MAEERLNWRVAAVVTVAGVTFIVAGVVAGKNTRGTWSSVFINLGTSVGLVVALIVVERRLTRHVTDRARTAAREEVRTETAAIRDRLVRLENLDDAQAAARSESAARQADTMRRFRQSGLSVAAVGELLRAAADEQLFDFPGDPRFRTSADPHCHVLYMVGHADPKRVYAIFLDFEPIRADVPIQVRGATIQSPLRTDTMVLWFEDEKDPGRVAAELEAGLKRANLPVGNFSFQHALEQLHRAVEVMRAARDADVASGRRLDGRLIVLINDEWVLTSAGLEAVNRPVLFKHATGEREFGRGRVSLISVVRGSRFDIDESDSSWQEAFAWMRDREQQPVEFEDELRPRPSVNIIQG